MVLNYSYFLNFSERFIYKTVKYKNRIDYGIFMSKKKKADEDSSESHEPQFYYDNLEKYIRKEISAGKNMKQIRKNLIGAGWPKKIVSEILESDQVKKMLEPYDMTKPNVTEPKTDYSTDEFVIVLDNLTKEFYDKTVLDNISLGIKPGEVFGIIGLSGSGKTTLLNSIVGFLQPDKGDVKFLCEDPKKKEKKFISVYKGSELVKKAFGFASQDPSFYSRLTAEENLDHFGALYRIRGKRRKDNINNLLAMTELTDSKKTLARNLSGGMQKRLGIACSLIHEPHVLLMDEPTADLDPFLRKEMWHLIKKINSRGTTVILTSHFLSEIEHLCDRVAILHDSRLVALGTPDDLKEQYSRNEEVHLELESQRYGDIVKQIQTRPVHIDKIVNQEHKIVIYTREPEKVLHELLHIIESNNEKVVDLDINKPSLSEVFESFVNKRIVYSA